MCVLVVNAWLESTGILQMHIHCTVLVTHSVRTIYVSRESKASRQSTTEEIRSRALSGGTWPPVLIFPEGVCVCVCVREMDNSFTIVISGTTTNRKVLLKFKKGAFFPKLPVQAVLVKYNNKIVRIGGGGFLVHITYKHNHVCTCMLFHTYHTEHYLCK